MRLLDQLKDRVRPLLKFQDTPHRLAFAFAFGVALGVIPGTGAIAASACAAILRLNLPATILGALVTNPITLPFIYGGSFLIGKLLFGDQVFAQNKIRFLLYLAAGNLLLAIGLAFISYVVLRLILKYFRPPSAKAS